MFSLCLPATHQGSPLLQKWMLSSRAAAFSVQALLTSPREESKVGEQAQHQAYEDTVEGNYAKDFATEDTHVMVEAQDSCVGVNSQETAEVKSRVMPTRGPTSLSTQTHQEENLNHWEATMDGGEVESSLVNDEYTDDEELVVDVESCSSKSPLLSCLLV